MFAQANEGCSEEIVKMQRVMVDTDAVLVKLDIGSKDFAVHNITADYVKKI